MINIIDVTLRDGGHAVSFNWPIDFVTEYYETISNIKDVKYIELGYWGQTAKSKNMFYNLDFKKVFRITQGAGRKNVSIMVDYHYCSHNIKDYPTTDQNEIGMIRICARKKDIPEALEFANQLKSYSGLNVSLNIFNITNYSSRELLDVCNKISKSNIDFVYFADTHGHLDLNNSEIDFKKIVQDLNNNKINAGMHLHDHTGKAYSNFLKLNSLGFQSSDASLRGMGKGVGNLKIENVLKDKDSILLLNIANKYSSLLKMEENIYCILTAKYSITDYYGIQGKKINIGLKKFNDFCKTITGFDKDVFNPDLLENELKNE